MRPCDDKMFLANLQIGDIGIIRADNFFSTAQDWFRIQCEDEPSQYRASHAFIIKTPPVISEANGLAISEATIIKDIGDKTKCWVYRYSRCTPNDQQAILRYCASQEGKTFYSILGIAQFGAQYVASFFKKKIQFKDQPGKFCSEYVEDMMKDRKWPVAEPTYATTPSGLRYYLETSGQTAGYSLVGHYDGDGNYFIA